METRTDFYKSPEWLALCERVKERDGHRCLVAWLLGGECDGPLTVHHIVRRRDRPDLELADDNCGTVCRKHHPTWEAMAQYVKRSRRPLPPCRHFHPYRQGREQCDRERAERLGIVLT